MKPLPKKITKSFLFEIYKFNDIPYYQIRNFINDYLLLLGKNIRNRNVPKLIAYYLMIELEHLPGEFELNEVEIQDLKKLGYSVFWDGYTWLINKIN